MPVTAYHPNNGWPPSLLAHPAMSFMHAFTLAWCEAKTAHAQPYTEWLTSDFELVSYDGHAFVGEAAAKAFIASMKHYEKSTVGMDVVYMEDTEGGGYEGWAMGRIYVDFAGGEEGREKGFVDGQGRGWDVAVPRAYGCTFVRDESGPVGGVKLSKMVVVGDFGVVAKGAAKRGN